MFHLLLCDYIFQGCMKLVNPKSVLQLNEPAALHHCGTQLRPSWGIVFFWIPWSPKLKPEKIHARIFYCIGIYLKHKMLGHPTSKCWFYGKRHYYTKICCVICRRRESREGFASITADASSATPFRSHCKSDSRLLTVSYFTIFVSALIWTLMRRNKNYSIGLNSRKHTS